MYGGYGKVVRKPVSIAGIQTRETLNTTRKRLMFEILFTSLYVLFS